MRDSKRNTLATLTAFAILAITGCAGNKPPVAESDSDSRYIKMRHQIMYQNKEDTHVFEGYMIKSTDSLLVKAFAGPGVDLFTVVRSPNIQCGEIHIPGLNDKMDIQAIGDDIARIYLGGCDENAPGKQAHCAFNEEPMIETYGPGGRVITREFPSAHGIGLKILYEDFEPFDNGTIATKISLTWGDGSNQMIIKTVDVQPLKDGNPRAFQSC